jgi:hypothetical protein
MWGRLLKKTRGRQSRATVPLNKYAHCKYVQNFYITLHNLHKYTYSYYVFSVHVFDYMYFQYMLTLNKMAPQRYLLKNVAKLIWHHSASCSSRSQSRKQEYQQNTSESAF